MKADERPTAIDMLMESLDNGGGLQCPKCHCRDLRVVRSTDQFDEKKRRRECRHCGWRFNTYERAG